MLDTGSQKNPNPKRKKMKPTKTPKKNPMGQKKEKQMPAKNPGSKKKC